ncbi:unnamed protein product, partial [Brassica oleracea var. botrytis]
MNTCKVFNRIREKVPTIVNQVRELYMLVNTRATRKVAYVVYFSSWSECTKKYIHSRIQTIEKATKKLHACI